MEAPASRASLRTTAAATRRTEGAPTASRCPCILHPHVFDWADLVSKLITYLLNLDELILIKYHLTPDRFLRIHNDN